MGRKAKSSRLVEITGIIWILFIIVGLSSISLPSSDRKADGQGLRITSYNVQNLFDAEDDPRTRDEEFLPLKVKRQLDFQKSCGTQARASCRYRNWTDAHWLEKVQRIALVLNQTPKLRDEILILNEVENSKVIRALTDHYRAKDWKTLAWLPDLDPRGITSAVLSSLPQAQEPRLHHHPQISFSRGILETQLNYQKQVLVVFAFHFPSQLASPRDRRLMLALLENLIRQRESEGFIVIAGGDSNLSQQEQKEWIQETSSPLASNLSHHWGRRKDKGTYAWDGEWTFFDWIYLSPLWRQEASVRAHFQVLNKHKLQKKPDGSPEGFTVPSKPGVSDHFPVSVTLKKKDL